MDVIREITIMKKMNHPNCIRLLEVIDGIYLKTIYVDLLIWLSLDPNSDKLFLVIEYA